MYTYDLPEFQFQYKQHIYNLFFYYLKMACIDSIYNFLTCKSAGKFPDPYEFQFNGRQVPQQNQKIFQSNFVRTSKYTWFSFLPVGLLLQFQRLANIYFLLIAILQTIKIISPFESYTGWVPLCVVLAISMLREGYEYYQSYKSDNEMNFETKTQVRRNGVFIQVQWSKVLVGDIVKVQQQELFPADLILLASSAEGGVAFIQTASLDGQKNLKPRSAFNATIPYSEELKLDQLKGEWFGVPPDKELHKFSSKMKIGSQNIVFQGDKQLLYRGSRLKNTKWVFGLAIYTGKNTKIMLNSQSSSVKMSQIENKVNKILGIILLIQFIACLVIAILAGFFRAENYSKIHYIMWTQHSPLVDAVLAFFTYFVLINTMIPISLIVSIQIVKFSQSIFIDRDKLMYSSLRNKFVNVRSSSLNQQLGQIEYVFSDKTGTLTCNIMQFKIATIGDKLFGDLSILSGVEPQEDQSFHDQKLAAILSGNVNQPLQKKITVRNKEGGQEIHLSTMKELAEQYFQCLGLAHQVVVEHDKKGKPFYQGPSPDQITLVDAAKAMDFEFVKSTQQSTTIKIRGNDKTFELLDVFSFTSDRKRMSVLIRSNGIIKMYTKGADSIVKSRLANSSTLNLDDELNKFARIGLRTLLIAMRTVSEQEYSNFKRATQALPNQNKEAKLNQLISELQKGLYLIGATAVLDRLQDQVPQTIRDLIRANIKVWMLTGDKMETAENIAKSCNLIQSHFSIIRYEHNPQTDPSVLNYLRKLVQESQNLTKDQTPKAFLIEGSDLTPILANEDCRGQLANLAKNCEAVVCCRLLPIQKAQVVSVVRQKLNKITLSIGDGANDVPMIKTAHIGVGLFGQQGMGAVQASDYALPQFRMLWRLLLVHGRWNYIRVSEMILYFFYKNMLFTVPHLVYAAYMAYSGTSIYDDFYVAGYNLIFTSVPLVVRAVLQQDVNYVIYKQQQQNHEQTEMQLRVPSKPNVATKHVSKFLPQGYKVNKYLYRLFPKIYFIGQENCIFNYANYSLWLVQGIAEAVLISIFSIYIFSEISLDSTGINPDLWLTGLVIFSSVIMVVTMKLASHTKFWSALLVVSILVISLGLYVAYMWVSNFLLSDNIKGTSLIAWTTVQPYLVVLFCCCLVLAMDGVIISIDFERGGYTSKMRKVLQNEKQITKSELEIHSVHMTDGLTVIANQ